jgi:hypothetical protein
VILPVRWLYFNAQKQSKVVMLSWASSSEDNNKYFSVQRSTPTETWTSIGTVAAAGNSTTARYYNFTDDAPVEGINYYRIAQSDLDGKKVYSEVRSIKFSGERLPFKILVNPVISGSLLVQVNDEGVFSFYNSDGLLLWNRKLAPGNKAIEITGYTKGLYLLKSNGYLQKVMLQ